MSFEVNNRPLSMLISFKQGVGCTKFYQIIVLCFSYSKPPSQLAVDFSHEKVSLVTNDYVNSLNLLIMNTQQHKNKTDANCVYITSEVNACVKPM